MARFTSKVALITGASSGIGAAVARHLAAGECAGVALTARNKDKLDETAQACIKAGLKSSQILQLPADLCKSDLKSIVDETVARFGRLDILVNGAGILKKTSVETISMDDYDKEMDINLRSVVQMSTLALPHLIKTQGNIVNVSSVCGLRSFPGVLSYCISKAGVDQLTRCAALELAEKNVRVNAVNPGVIDTGLHQRDAGLDDAAYAKFLEHSKTTHPLGRVGTADEVANAVAYLASDDSAFITGVCLNIDGGRGQTCAR